MTVWVPVTLGLRGEAGGKGALPDPTVAGGNPRPPTGGGSREAWPERLDKSSGAPAARPPGTPMSGASGAGGPTAGRGGASESGPHVRGAPRAGGVWIGSNTSRPPRVWAEGAELGGGAVAGGTGGG